MDIFVATPSAKFAMKIGPALAGGGFGADTGGDLRFMIS